VKDLRREYASRRLDEADADADPMALFQAWFADALAANLLDANAMSLATSTAAGEPSVRTVLLKEADERGFVFFTHYTSPKGQDLDVNPRAALLFFWAPLERQVRITGAVARASRE
jgi:pyridoxamine 5'-phosphate oxidase